MMTFDQFSQYLAWAIYILIFCVVAVKAVRRPTHANVDIALLFAVPVLTINISVATSLQIIQASFIMGALSSSLLVALGYMLFRLVDDFSAVPAWLSWAAPAALVLLVFGLFLMPLPRPAWFNGLAALYLVALLFYTAVAFIRESRHSSGVTMRRMIAVAIGSTALGILFLLAGLLAFFPNVNASVSWLLDLVQIGSGIGFYIGFATPGIVRRSWQEPELRAFLGRAASLPRLPTTELIIKELERGAATSVGAPSASIGLWDEKSGRLHFETEDGGSLDMDPGMTLSGRAFLSQRPVFSDNTARDNPATAELSRSRGAVAMLAAPITAGGKRLGVLSVYGTRAPIFAEEDLELVRLLADQAAVILESRGLIDEAVRVQAREEVTRLKEDFLSAAAHDLKTPLTALVMQTELLERRALRAPQAPVDLNSLGKLKNEAYRLKELVLELLDAARAEQGKLVGEFREVDLIACAQQVCARYGSPRHPCDVIADGQAVGLYDGTRIVQLLGNLVENAIKYSPDGGPVAIRIWQEKSKPNDIINGSSDDSSVDGEAETWNRIAVTDRGIGIPKEDLPNVFERFHRGSNVDDRHFSGMGLGLFICLGIVEQHGGRIWVESPATPAVRYPVGKNGADNGTVHNLQGIAGSASNSLYGSEGHDNRTGNDNDNGNGNENDIGNGNDNANGSSYRSSDIRANPGATFHVALPAVPAAALPEPAPVGSVEVQ